MAQKQRYQRNQIDRIEVEDNMDRAIMVSWEFALVLSTIKLLKILLGRPKTAEKYGLKQGSGSDSSSCDTPAKILKDYENNLKKMQSQM